MGRGCWLNFSQIGKNCNGDEDNDDYDRNKEYATLAEIPSGKYREVTLTSPDAAKK